MPCKECAKRVELDRAYVEGEGPKPAKFLVVGEAPGRTENEQGQPFVGKTGKMLKRAIQTLGGTALLKKCYFTNAVRVWPGSGNPTPPMTWIRKCGESCMVKTVEEVQPEVIICVGQSALKLFTDDGNIPLVRNRREVFTYTSPEGTDIPVVATFHPSYVARVPDAYDWWMADLHAYLVERTYKREDFSVSFRHDNSLPRWLRTPRGQVTVDIESTGFFPWEGEKLRLVGIGPGSSPPFLLTDGWEELTPAIIDNPDVTVLGANTMFDIMWLLKDRQMPKCKALDIQYQHYLLDERYPVRALKHLHMLYTGWEQYDVGKGGVDSDMPTLMEYNARDIVTTGACYRAITKDLNDDKIQYQKTTALMSEVIPILAAMTRTGIPVDLTKLDKLAEEQEQICKDAAKGMQEIWERHKEEEWDIRVLNRPHDLSDFLFKHLKIRIPKKVDKLYRKDGRPRTAKYVLEAVVEQDLDASGFVQALLDYRATHENYKKYVLDVQKRVDKEGRVHPKYNILAKGDRADNREGTVTGRLSVKRPAIHNIPKGHGMREAFVPLPGHSHLVQVDLSTIELVMLAQLSKDPALIHMVGNPDEDLHQWAADLCDSLGYPMARKMAKVVNFGILYGVSTKGLASQTTLDLDGAQRVVQEWYAKFPGVRKLRDKIEYQAIKKGWVEAPYGQRRNFPLGMTRFSSEGGRACRQAFNFTIQATANMLNLMILADWVNEGLHELAWPLTCIHDAIIFSTDNPELVMEELDYYYKEILPHSFADFLGEPILLPIKAEAEVGPHWGAMEYAQEFTT